MDKIIVTREVLDGLEAVRTSGLTNMLDRPVVVELARQMGFDETARWIEVIARSTPKAYSRASRPKEVMDSVWAGRSYPGKEAQAAR